MVGTYINNSNDNLISPPFDFSNAINAKLSFYNWIHAEANWDGGRIDYSTDNGATWQVLGTSNDPKGVNWYNNSSLISTQKPGWDGLSFGWVKSEYLLSQFNNYPNPIKFRFNFSSDGSVNGFDGWAIDDFKIELPITVNALTNTIGAGGPIILPGAKAITANIKNGGAIDLSTVDITLEIDGNIIVTDTRNFIPPLPFNGSVNHTFSMPWNAVSGCSNIRVWTSDPNFTVDMDLTDDTSSAELCVFETINTFPYCNDFETGNKWTTYNAKNNSTKQSWELGTPSQASINSAFSGNNAWMTKLNQNYSNEDASVLLTPGFNVVSNNCYRFSFKGNFITEELLDGGSIDFSYDDGVTWIPFGDTSTNNWYNTFNIFAFGTPFAKSGWSGNSNGWNNYEKFHYGQSNGVVIFRFWFASDLTLTNEGWAIDDFCFEELLPNCVTSVDEQQDITLQSVFPNPTNNYVNIAFQLAESSEIEIEIIDIPGKNVINYGIKKYSVGEHKLQLDTKDLKPGIYFIRINSENHSTNKKLVIVN